MLQLMLVPHPSAGMDPVGNCWHKYSTEEIEAFCSSCIEREALDVTDLSVVTLYI